MTKLGVHSYVFVETWSDDQLPILDRVQALGAAIVEIGVGDDVVFTPRLTRQRAEALGLALAISPGGTWPLACDLASDEASERRQGLAWHKRQVDLAAALGAVAYTGALYGHTGVVKRRKPPCDEAGWVAEGLHALAEYGQGLGVEVVIEPMSHFRTHVVNTPAQAMRLVDLADHANLSVLLDTYHLVTEIRDYGQAVATIGDRLWGIHACENDRGVPGGGLVPWDSLFDALRQSGFDGPILLETYNSSQGDFAYRRGMFHDVCPDPEDFVRRGFAFIRDHLH
jgi:D-psicose/D-tagatose/L-ribulose 3-epimerase